MPCSWAEDFKTSINFHDLKFPPWSKCDVCSPGSLLPTPRDNLLVLSVPEMMCCPETSVTNYHSTLSKIPEECRSHLWIFVFFHISSNYNASPLSLLIMSLFSIKTNYEFCHILNMKVVHNAVLPTSEYDGFNFILQPCSSHIYYMCAAGLISQRFSV